MTTSALNPDDFCRPGTRRVETFGAAARAPIVACAGTDGRVSIWDVRAKVQVFAFDTCEDNGGVSVAMSSDGRTCFAGTYHEWGVAAFDLDSARERWRRTDLERVRGVAALDERSIVTWFERRPGFTVDADTGEFRERHLGLRHFTASRFGPSSLTLAKQFSLTSPAGDVHTWAPESFAVLSVAFSPTICVISESVAPVRAFNVSTGDRLWEYRSRPGAHVLQLDYASSLGEFVALEYAYSEAAREAGPMMELLRVNAVGGVRDRKAVRGWPDAVFCAEGELLLNGLGELFDVSTAEVIHVFDFPR
jgi:WD40 repeat protein